MMLRIRVFLARHVGVQLVLSILAASALIMLLFPGRSVLSVLVRTTITSVGAVAVVLAQRRRERRAAGGSVDDVVALGLKLRRGEVPSAPDERRAMRALVAQRLHRMRHRVPALVLLAFLFTAGTLLTVLTGSPLQAVAFGVFAVLCVGWSIHNSNVQHRRLRSMEAALNRETPPVPAEGNRTAAAGDAA
ncbi:hypothetical protein JK359_10300 [Streptomyces actinomycinicus]|uniref:Uncharacterized protein n=1 Tax=Streptomyces actinomycinicus TaxID=1695166 RepID=A0A937EHU8_9ACTN|nr:hypothetical protein [Streptomyces actinomycinicus]MBL1082369.1 hypothetical protein [Streptomyces actinomycinicus]